MSSELPILYVKTGCPWCAEAVRFLTNNGISFREKNVTAEHSAYTEMLRRSGQSKAPALVWDDRHVLADFGVDELKEFLRQRNVGFEDS